MKEAEMLNRLRLNYPDVLEGANTSLSMAGGR